MNFKDGCHSYSNAVIVSSRINFCHISGQIAIDVGLFVPEVILYVAVSMIGAYATPSYELGLGNKVGKLFVIILTGLFHEMGFVMV